MRGLLTALIRAGIVLMPLLCCRSAVGSDLPPRAERRLERILSRPEFQPRRRPPDSFLARLKTAVAARALEILNDAERRLAAWLASSSIGRSLEPFLKTLAGLIELLAGIVYYAAIPLLAIIALWFMVRRRPRRAAVERAASGTPAPPELPPCDLRELARRGEWLQLLAEMRRRVRKDLQARYALSPAMTDREVVRRLPAEDRRRDLFQRIAALFERTAFAGRPFASEELLPLVQEYEIGGGTG